MTGSLAPGTERGLDLAGGLAVGRGPDSCGPRPWGTVPGCLTSWARRGCGRAARSTTGEGVNVSGCDGSVRDRRGRCVVTRPTTPTHDRTGRADRPVRDSAGEGDRLARAGRGWGSAPWAESTTVPKAPEGGSQSSGRVPRRDAGRPSRSGPPWPSPGRGAARAVGVRWACHDESPVSDGVRGLLRWPVASWRGGLLGGCLLGGCLLGRRPVAAFAAGPSSRGPVLAGPSSRERPSLGVAFVALSCSGTTARPPARPRDRLRALRGRLLEARDPARRRRRPRRGPGRPTFCPVPTGSFTVPLTVLTTDPTATSATSLILPRGFLAGTTTSFRSGLRRFRRLPDYFRAWYPTGRTVNGDGSDEGLRRRRGTGRARRGSCRRGPGRGGRRRPGSPARRGRTWRG